MTLFQIVSLLMTMAALFGYINHRWLKLEPSVGLLAISLSSSLGIMAISALFPHLDIGGQTRIFLGDIDFNRALMHGMLAFLLFAGAMHVDIEYFVKRKITIGTLATIGLLISTFIVGYLSWLVFQLLGLQISFLACLVSGSLISPTDPIAVMGTLKTLQAPKDLEANIAGESLFNDGVAVVVFSGLASLLAVQQGHHTLAGHAAEGVNAAMLGRLFLQEAGGGIVLGLIFGYIAYRLMLSIDDYKVEVMITLALVMGGYSLAGVVGVSGPIAVVVAGILIGNRGRAFAMSHTVADYVEKVWEMIDEILNALLFLLIGIEVLVVKFSVKSLLAGLIIIAIVLIARFISVWLPISIIGLRNRFPRGVVRILTWAGLRGGISVALALSLPPSPERDLILTSTYTLVLFSILVQGMTIKKVLRKYL